MSAAADMLRAWVGKPSPAPVRLPERQAPIVSLDTVFDEIAREDRAAALAPICRPEHER